MRLLIAIPCMDQMATPFVESLTRLIVRLKDDGVNFEVKIISGTLVYIARDKLASYAIQQNCTHVLWLDSDVVFGPDLLDDLLFSETDHIVTGIYHTRRAPYVSTVFKSIDPVIRFERDEYPHSPFTVAGCGFGCVLMRTQVLRDVMMAHKTCFSPMLHMGEDIAFCKRATDMGYRITADPSVRLGHIGHVTIYPDDDMGGNYERR